MPTKKKIPVKQITSWSYSRYTDYKLCPRKAKLKHIDKIKEPPNKAMARGIEIHNMAEEYIKGVSKRMPKDLKLFSEEFKDLRKRYKKKINGMTVEDTWAFTKDWTITSWDDWNNCWLRMKLDCAFAGPKGDVLHVWDWKTGKFRGNNIDDYVEQLELFALGAFLVFDHINIVMPKLCYLDEGIIYPEEDSKEEEFLTFHRNGLKNLIKTWEKRTKAMLNDKVFSPRPNNLCSWCHYRKSNKANGGGQCEY